METYFVEVAFCPREKVVHVDKVYISVDRESQSAYTKKVLGTILTSMQCLCEDYLYFSDICKVIPYNGAVHNELS